MALLFRLILSTSVTYSSLVFLWAVFPIYFHCIRSLHFLKDVSEFILDSSQLYVLVYICYIFLVGFLMCLHCIRSLRFFFERLADFVFSIHISSTTVTSLCGFPYLFPLYTFVRFWKKISDFFRLILFTSVT